MGIQKCKKCGTKFKYTTLLKQLEGFTNPLHCSNCGAAHYVTLNSSIVHAALIMIPLFSRHSIRSLLPTLPLTLVVYLIYYIILKFLAPYILRYKLKDTN